MTIESSAAAGAVPRRLWLIMALLFCASFLNYLDRQTLSVLKPTIKQAFAVDDRGYAVLLNVFTFCYAGAYIASGWIVDRIGARRALALFIGGWSLATIGCGLVSTVFAFGAFRALLGLMEPGNFPAALRAMTLWAPPGRRAFLMSLTGGGSTVGAIVAAPFIAWIADTYRWSDAFVLPGIAGLFLVLAWWLCYRDPQPKELAGAGMAADAIAAQSLPWKRLWREPTTWGVILARFVSDPVWYFCLFWMPGYFQEQRGLSLRDSGWVGWIPFFIGNVGAFAGAALSDRIGRRRNDPLRGRRRVLIGAACFGPLVILVPHMPSLAGTVALLSLTAIISLVWLMLLGPLVADAFPTGNAASVWAIAGAFGATGAMLFNYGVGTISTTLGTKRMFLLLGIMHPLAAVILHFLVSRRKITADAETSSLS